LSLEPLRLTSPVITLRFHRAQITLNLWHTLQTQQSSTRGSEESLITLLKPLIYSATQSNSTVLSVMISVAVQL
jgi:hypothetical protein